MKLVILAAIATLFTAGCKSAPKQDSAGLEKYPHCYHKNVKIAKKCIEKNDAGENVTALQLENTAYPGNTNNFVNSFIAHRLGVCFKQTYYEIPPSLGRPNDGYGSSPQFA